MKLNHKIKGLIFAFFLLFCGCSILAGGTKENIKKAEVYRVSQRQLPPDPVYNRVRPVHLPITYPSANGPEAGDLELRKNLKISVKNVPLEEVARALALSAKYSSYTASTVARNKVSLNSYGYLDHVAADLAAISKTNVVVDHKNREIRVLEKVAETDLETEAKFASAE